MIRIVASREAKADGGSRRLPCPGMADGATEATHSTGQTPYLIGIKVFF